MDSLIISEIQQFFKFLSNRENEIFTCCVMNHDSSGVIAGYGKWFVNLKEIVADFPTLFSTHEATLHTSLNQTNLTGRRARDIQSCRVLCVDLDGDTDKDLLKGIIEGEDVQMVVESSPGRYHLYWKVSASIGLDTWKQFQLGLAQQFNGDKNLCDITHNIRVPGVPRGTKDGGEFVPRIVWLASEVSELDYDGVIGLFPTILDNYEEALAVRVKAKKGLKRGRSVDLARSVSEVGRNKTLYTALVGWIVNDPKDTSQSEAWDHAKELNSKFEIPLYEPEVEKIWRSAWDDACEIIGNKTMAELAMLTPVVDTVSHGGTVGGTENGVLETVVATENGYGPGGVKVGELFKYDYSTPAMRDNKYTEKGLADRVIQRFYDALIKAEKTTYAFNKEEMVWTIQESSSRSELAGMTELCALDILHEPEFIAAFWATPGKTPSLIKKRQAEERMMTFRLHAQAITTILNSGKIRKVSPKIFDATPEFFYCSQGVLNTTNTECRNPYAKDYLLNRSHVVWNTEAKCEKWLEFLAEVFQKNTDPKAMVLFMQELFGYSISGSISEQKLFLHSGDGCNGKSKVLQALATIGSGYCTYTDPDELVKSKSGFTRNIERFGAKIEGKRIVIIDDIDVKTSWNEAFVKSVTSTTLRARGEYEKSRLIANRAKLHLALNMMPTPDAENYGLLRRMCVIPYNMRFDPSPKKGMEIDQMIEEEAEGILVWAVKGYQRFANNKGLTYPPELDSSVEEYRQEHFKLEAVIEELFAVPTPENPGDWEWLTTLTVDVNNHLKQSGESRQISPEELGHALKRKPGIESEKRWDAERKNMFRAARLALRFERPACKPLSALLQVHL